MSKEVKKVLVIQAGSIGQFVLSLAAMKRIRQAHLRARVTLLTRPQFESLAKASPYFNEVEAEEKPVVPSDWLRIRNWIKREKFDRVYDLENSGWTTALFALLRPFPPVWSGTARGARLRHRNPDRVLMHTLERQAEQLKVAGIWPDAPIGPGDAPGPDLSWILRRVQEPRPVAGAPPPRPFVLMVPGGVENRPEKRWPLERYCELARQLRERGYDIVIIGGPQESALARTIQKAAGNARDLTGRTDFSQIAVLGARAVLAVGNNTGPMHLIAAAGAPTIAVVPDEPDALLTAPRGHVAVLQASSLDQLTVETVATAANSLLPR